MTRGGFDGVCMGLFNGMFEEVGRMSRRRSNVPHRAISVTLPIPLLQEIEDQLTRKQSRSAWLAAAAEAKLRENAFTVREASNNQLLAALVERDVLKVETYNALKD